jgi:1-acyl-sn-glycerol-3-phosphate acyltransferase
MTRHPSAARPLLRQPAFRALFFAQFLGAFNDNLFKSALVLLLTFGAASHASWSAEQLVALSSGAFILPFFVFSALAGQLADKLVKARLIRWVKGLELAVMLIASAGFLTRNLALLFAALFLAGTQAALFGPLKYGVLPELVTARELGAANAAVETGTFLAILLGTIGGGALIALPSAGPWLVSACLVLIAGLGWLAARRLPHGPRAAPGLCIERGIAGPTWRLLQSAARPRSVLHSILGISWFWLTGAAVLAVLPGLVKVHAGGSESLVTYLLALFSVGVGAGSLLYGRLSRRRGELGVVPLGALGMSVFLFDVAATLGRARRTPDAISVVDWLGTLEGLHLSASFLLFAVASGLFIVPLYTLLLERSAPELRSRVIAANNVANAGFMVAGALLLVGLFAAGATIPQILALLALSNLGVAVYTYLVMPQVAFRFVCFLVARVLYRLRVRGAQHVPSSGAAVLVCNHVSFVDWLIISASCQRPLRFVMHRDFLKLPFTRRFFRDMSVIPICSVKEDERLLEAAFARISAELRQGELVCLFPEGRLTTSGEIGAFRAGIERVLRDDPVPVIPMHLAGLWGSVFSRYRPRRLLRRFRTRVRLEVGAPLSPQGASAALIEARVRALAKASQDAGAEHAERVANPVAAAAVPRVEQCIDALTVARHLP